LAVPVTGQPRSNAESACHRLHSARRLTEIIPLHVIPQCYSHAEASHVVVRYFFYWPGLYGIKRNAKGKPLLSLSPRSLTARILIVRRTGENTPSWAYARISASTMRSRGITAIADSHEHRIRSGRSRVLASNWPCRQKF
jgi:hypothetical protein